MLYELIAWLLLLCTVGVSNAQSICPVSYDSRLDIYSQNDADALSECETISGTLVIDGSNSSSPIVLDGPRNITGDLIIQVGLDGIAETTAISLKSLIFVAGQIQMLGDASISTTAKLTTLDFPSLTTVGQEVSCSLFSSLQTLNFPTLETVGGNLNLSSLTSLSALDISSLQSAGSINLEDLPSLQKLSFGSSFNSITGYHDQSVLSIQNTGLSSLDGLAFDNATDITIMGNTNLTSLQLGLEVLRQSSAKYSYYGALTIQNNGNGLLLDLPNLKELDGGLAVSQVSSINMPQLEVIGDSMDIGTSGMVVSYSTYPLSTTLTSLNAPKLLTVTNSIRIDSSPQLFNIAFPVLQNASVISIQNTPAPNLQGGLLLPSLVELGTLIIESVAPFCAPFDNLRCRGVISQQYSCGNDTSPRAIPVSSDATYCNDEFPADGSWPRSKKLTIGLSVGLGGGLLIIVSSVGVCCFLGRRRRVAIAKMASQSQNISKEKIVHQKQIGNRVQIWVSTERYG